MWIYILYISAYKIYGLYMIYIYIYIRCMEITQHVYMIYIIYDIYIYVYKYAPFRPGQTSKIFTVDIYLI